MHARNVDAPDETLHLRLCRFAQRGIDLSESLRRRPACQVLSLTELQSATLRVFFRATTRRRLRSWAYVSQLRYSPHDALVFFTFHLVVSECFSVLAAVSVHVFVTLQVLLCLHMARVQAEDHLFLIHSRKTLAKFEALSGAAVACWTRELGVSLNV